MFIKLFIISIDIYNEKIQKFIKFFRGFCEFVDIFLL
jgi:hypothetical protein